MQIQDLPSSLQVKGTMIWRPAHPGCMIRGLVTLAFLSTLVGWAYVHSEAAVPSAAKQRHSNHFQYELLDGVELVWQRPRGAERAVILLAHGCSHSATDFFPSERNAPSASAFRRRGASSKLRSLGGLLLLRSLQLTVSTPAVGIRRPTAREYASPARQQGNNAYANNCATTHCCKPLLSERGACCRWLG